MTLREQCIRVWLHLLPQPVPLTACPVVATVIGSLVGLFKVDFWDQIKGQLNYLDMNLNQIKGQIKYLGLSLNFYHIKGFIKYLGST